jgi:hypothetical protein
VPADAMSQFIQRYFWRCCVSLLLVALLIRLIAAIGWQQTCPADSKLKFGDSDSYWYLATTIAQGEPYQYGSPNSRIFRAPLYPCFLAPWTMLDPKLDASSTVRDHHLIGVLGARAAGCLLGVACIGVLVFMTFQIVSGSSSPAYRFVAATVTGLLAALYPGAIGMSIFVLSEALFCPWMVLSLLLTWHSMAAMQNGNHARAARSLFAAGLLSGAACLTRPSWSLWPVFLFVYLLLAWRQMNRGKEPVAMPEYQPSVFRFARIWGAYCVGIIVVMTPWWIRNYAISGKWVPTTLQVGASLYDGLHSGATGSSDENMAFVDRFVKEQEQEDERNQNAGTGLDGCFEWRLDRRIRNAAIDWARENSSDALWLGMVKLGKTWSPLPVARELGSSAVRWAEAIGYSVIIVLACLGMVRSFRWTGAWLFAMPCLYFAILHMVFIGSVRYRQPAVLVLCVLGGLGGMVIMEWIRPMKPANRSVSEG